MPKVYLTAAAAAAGGGGGNVRRDGTTKRTALMGEDAIF